MQRVVGDGDQFAGDVGGVESGGEFGGRTKDRAGGQRRVRVWDPGIDKAQGAVLAAGRAEGGGEGGLGGCVRREAEHGMVHHCAGEEHHCGARDEARGEMAQQRERGKGVQLEHATQVVVGGGAQRGEPDGPETHEHRGKFGRKFSAEGGPRGGHGQIGEKAGEWFMSRGRGAGMSDEGEAEAV